MASKDFKFAEEARAKVLNGVWSDGRKRSRAGRPV